jgi:hypothetical protein
VEPKGIDPGPPPGVYGLHGTRDGDGKDSVGEDYSGEYQAGASGEGHGMHKENRESRLSVGYRDP